MYALSIITAETNILSKLIAPESRQTYKNQKNTIDKAAHAVFFEVTQKVTDTCICCELGAVPWTTKFQNFNRWTVRNVVPVFIFCSVFLFSFSFVRVAFFSCTTFAEGFLLPLDSLKKVTLSFRLRLDLLNTRRSLKLTQQLPVLH